MNKRLTCEQRREGGRRCGRFLGEVQGGKVLIFCPACRGMHAVDVLALAAALLEQAQGGHVGEDD